MPDDDLYMPTDRQLQIAFHVREITKHAHAAALLEAPDLVKTLEALQTAVEKGNFEEVGKLGREIEAYDGSIPMTLKLESMIARFLAERYEYIPLLSARGGPL